MADSSVSMLCPNRLELEEFVAGESSSGDLAAHVSTCPACHKLVRHIQKENAFLRQTAGISTARPRDRFAHLLPSFELPGYRVVREIHRGGQGVVFHAVQESTQRDVAVKVMREGPFAGLSDRARFDREVQILAQLEHPSIVAIHDSGASAGCFYFVMDFVRGVPLDQWLQVHDGAPLRLKLNLFVRICEAVNAAHLRGVIHRDLKPSNILVTEADSRSIMIEHADRASADARFVSPDPYPKILDFGLAKTTLAGDLNATMTREGQFLGSPPWTSPEQAAGDPVNVDVRSDVYSLGVLLYVMLTGKHPYPITTNLRDMIDRVLTAVPPRPSRVGPGLDDELDTIALQCLAKERERRYQSAGELARDVNHYLAGEPIDAKRDSRLYVLRKLVMRNKPIVAAAAVVLLALLGGLAAATYGLGAAREARERENAAAEREKYERERAAGEATKSRAVVQVLSEVIAPDDPIFQSNRSGGLPLDDWIENGQFAGQPDVEAAVRTIVAGLYREKHHLDRAEVQLRSTLRIRLESLAPHDPGIGQTLNDLAEVLLLRGSLTEAERRCREGLEIRRHIQGPLHVDVVRSLNTLAGILLMRHDYAQAEAVIHESLAACRQILPQRHVLVARAFAWLSRLQSERHETIPAEQSARKALVMWLELLPDRHPDVLNGIVRWADTLAAVPARGAAGQSQIAARGSSFSPEHLRNVVDGLRRSGVTGADRTWRELLEVKQSLLGNDHSDLAETLLALGRELNRQSRHADAEVALRHALSILEESYGPSAMLVAECLHDLRVAITPSGRLVESAELAQRRFEIYWKHMLGKDDLGLGVIQREAASTWNRAGQPRRAEQGHREVIQFFTTTLGADHAETGRSYDCLATLLLEQQRFAEAEAAARRAVEIRQRIVSSLDLALLSSRCTWAEALFQSGRYREAEPIYFDLATAAQLLAVNSAPPEFLALIPDRLSEIYDRLGDTVEAARWRQICDPPHP